jgi:uncharacterized membrane protein
MIKHLIIILLGLVPLSVLIGLGLLYHYEAWIGLVVALALLVYPLGLLMGKLFPPEN